MKKIITFMCAAALALPFSANAETFMRPLSVGSRGDDVTALQQILAAKGFFKVAVTGYFGAITKQAVADFQTANSLEAVGSVGPKTRALLNAHLSAGTPSAPSTPAAPTAPLPPGTPSIPLSTSTPIATSSIPAPMPPVAPVTPAASDELTVTVLTPEILPRDTTYTVFSVATNRPATCRFGTTAGMTLASMTGFQSTNGTIHTYQFSSLGNGYLYAYYVKCEDVSNLKVTPEIYAKFLVSSQ